MSWWPSSWCSTWDSNDHVHHPSHDDTSLVLFEPWTINLLLNLLDNPSYKTTWQSWRTISISFPLQWMPSQSVMTDSFHSILLYLLVMQRTFIMGSFTKLLIFLWTVFTRVLILHFFFDDNLWSLKMRRRDWLLVLKDISRRLHYNIIWGMTIKDKKRRGWWSENVFIHSPNLLQDFLWDPSWWKIMSNNYDEHMNSQESSCSWQDFDWICLRSLITNMILSFRFLENLWLPQTIFT